MLRLKRNGKIEGGGMTTHTHGAKHMTCKVFHHRVSTDFLRGAPSRPLRF